MKNGEIESDQIYMNTQKIFASLNKEESDKVLTYILKEGITTPMDFISYLQTSYKNFDNQKDNTSKETIKSK